MAEIAHRLEVEAVDLGTDVRAVLLELIDLRLATDVGHKDFGLSASASDFSLDIGKFSSVA